MPPMTANEHMLYKYIKQLWGADTLLEERIVALEARIKKLEEENVSRFSSSTIGSHTDSSS